MSGSPNGFPRQLPLGFGREAGLARDDLVVTAANAAAVRLIDAWPDWPSPLVVLSGPAGSGKSHLASVWQSMSHARMLPPHQIGQPDLPERPAILIEDADRSGRDEAGMFHLINAVRAASGSLLITARTAPSAWNVTIADLASRLRAATLVEIAPPDDALLAAVIVKLFADRQVEVPPQVVSYLVQRMDRSLAQAMRVVDRIDAWSLERKSRITRALASQALAELEHDSPGDDLA